MPGTGKRIRIAKRQRVERQSVERDRADQIQEDIARQRPRCDLTNEDEIFELPSGAPVSVLLNAEPKTFIQTPLTPPHGVAFAGPTEVWCAISDAVIQRRDFPATEIAGAVVIQCDQQLALPVTYRDVPAAWCDNERIIRGAPCKSVGNRTARQPLGGPVAGNEAAHTGAHIVNTKVAREAADAATTVG